MKILELFRSEIRYGKSTMAECCKNLSVHMEDPYRKALQETYRIYQEYQMGIYQNVRKLDNGQSAFQSVFCAEMERCLLELPLSPEDREAFLEPFRTGGFQDGEMQLKCLEQGLERLRGCMETAEEELPGKCRLAVGLGGMGGLLLLIILL